MNWYEQAACLGDVDDQKWYPNKGNQEASIAEAKATCADCPVKAECLETALQEEQDSGGRYGFRGGLTPQERDTASKRPGYRQPSDGQDQPGGWDRW